MIVTQRAPITLNVICLVDNVIVKQMLSAEHVLSVGLDTMASQIVRVGVKHFCFKTRKRRKATYSLSTFQNNDVKCSICDN